MRKRSISKSLAAMSDGAYGKSEEEKDNSEAGGMGGCSEIYGMGSNSWLKRIAMLFFSLQPVD
jgi:hypothetical protein